MIQVPLKLQKILKRSASVGPRAFPSCSQIGTHLLGPSDLVFVFGADTSLKKLPSTADAVLNVVRNASSDFPSTSR